MALGGVAAEASSGSVPALAGGRPGEGPGRGDLSSGGPGSPAASDSPESLNACPFFFIPPHTLRVRNLLVPPTLNCCDSSFLIL